MTMTTDRQTHYEYRHPNGETWTGVRDNGPSWIKDASGTIVSDYVPWAARDKTDNLRYIMVTVNGESVRLQQVSESESQKRFWCPMQGYGWLVYEVVKGERDPWSFRFESDQGVITKFTAHLMAVGRHNDPKWNVKPKTGPSLARWNESQHWRTFASKYTVRMFRDLSFEDLPEIVYVPKPKRKPSKQLALPGVSS